MWWSNNEQRRRQKDHIKMIIKRKKLSEKNSGQVITTSADSPPGLSHSLPTSATFSDNMDRTRSASIDSQFSLQFDFSAPPNILDYSSYNAQMHSSHSQFAPYYPEYLPPYEVDVKTERQMFVNDVPTRRESTISTFSTYFPPPPESVVPSFPIDAQWQEEQASVPYEERRESMTEEPINMNFFDFSHGPVAETRQVAIELDESDRNLLDHFIADVIPTIFPILETNQHGSTRSDLILPALENKCYLHCCLSISAQHLKATMGLTDEQIDNDIMRHRYATISELCEALYRDEEHQQILEAALGMIFFQCSVGRSTDCLPDVPWHQHFQAAISLVEKLDLPRLVTEKENENQRTPFNMTLTAWIDIMGATMKGRAPQFAHTYREKHLSTPTPTTATSNTSTQASSLGLRELMGCDDKIMYLISEIACLEALKIDGMDDITLCQHVHSLGDNIGTTEIGEIITSPYNSNGVLSPKQLCRNITAAYRIAARIYLCSLVPGFSPAQASCLGLVNKLAGILEYIPSGPNGFDSSLTWVYLIGGSVSTANSSLRALFENRKFALGEAADFGSFGRLVVLLREVWTGMDERTLIGAEGYVSWRDTMVMKEWDFLLI